MCVSRRLRSIGRLSATPRSSCRTRGRISNPTAPGSPLSSPCSRSSASKRGSGSALIFIAAPTPRSPGMLPNLPSSDLRGASPRRARPLRELPAAAERPRRRGQGHGSAGRTTPPTPAGLFAVLINVYGQNLRTSPSSRVSLSRRLPMAPVSCRGISSQARRSYSVATQRTPSFGAPLIGSSRRVSS